MVALAVVGAVVITAALIWYTLAYLAVCYMSDESFFFGWKYYRKEWLISNSIFLVPIVGGWVLWWVHIGSKITIGFK